MSYVAEVWLEWPLCKGSTMYRAQARTKLGAYMKVRLAALLLDLLLPSKYRDTDYLGRVHAFSYDYGIAYCVRKLTESETQNGVRNIWSSVLPGHSGFHGEHRENHPWNDDLDKASTAGFKL